MRYVEGSKKVFMETGTKFPDRMIWSVALLKRCAAQTNVSLGLLEPKVGEAIINASEEVMRGEHADKVLVDVFQTGSGTGINMNLNELIAERASEMSGLKIHPNDHVNMGQSSNDVVPTAIRLAAVSAAQEELRQGFKKIVVSLETLADRCSDVYKAGRTHLRDALPVTMGQEFGAYADAFRHDENLVDGALTYVKELPIGGTAVGTGLNTHPSFGELMVRSINAVTGLDFSSAKNKFRAARLLSDMAALSAALRILALDLYRLCQDLRLMFSGPITGLNEIDIPTQQEVAGSSIMPGKTNPVTVESAMLVCAQTIGLDQANQMASLLGEFELSMGVPLMGFNVVTQIRLVSEALCKMSDVVLDHVEPNTQLTRRYAESSPALITVLSPVIGYDKASRIGKELVKGSSIREALADMGYSDAQIDEILNIKKLVEPGIPAKEHEERTEK
jgi:fumarate hydratase class II